MKYFASVNRLNLKSIFQVFLIVLLVGMALAPVQPVRAAGGTYTVNRADDPVPAGVASTCLVPASSDCSLREAVIKANANPGSAIQFAAALNGTPIVLSRTGNDANASAGDLDINASTNIVGNGSANTIIQGAADASYTSSIGDKVFGVNQDGTFNGLTVNFSALTIRYGDNNIPNGDPSFAYTGGGVDVYQTGSGNVTTFTDCVISFNRNRNSYGGGLNFDQAGSGTLTLTNVTFDNNKTLGLTGGQSTGGALNIFGDTATVTITNSTFTNNATLPTTSGGGAIYFRPTNVMNLAIHNSDFNGNSSGGNGGGIYVNIPALSAASSVVTIDQDTKIRNNVSGGVAGGSGGGSGLFLGGGSLTTTPITLSKVTISGNHEGGSATTHNGGGGVLIQRANVKVEYSRIVGNTISGGSGTGLFKNTDTGAVTATNNWWGCSTGPAAAPCDTALLAGGSAGTLTATPYFRVATTPGAATIATNQTTSLTASVNTNSTPADVSANVDRLLSLPVTWSAVNGAISAADTAISSVGGSKGTAAATFTATAAGTGKGIAVVDNDSVTGAGSNLASITINKADTTAAITSDLNLTTASVTGQPVTISFTVTGAFGNVPTAPTGNVTVTAGLDSCTGDIAVGSCALTFTSAGAKTLTAIYNGDANFNVSLASAGADHTVNKADTTASITSDTPDPSVVGQPVTFNYAVAVTAPGAGTPTGNVTVTNGTSSCIGTVAAGSCTLTPTAVSTDAYTATYAGDANFNASPASATAAHTVNKASTTTTITAHTPDPSVVGNAVTVNYSVAATAPGAGTPTGNVTVSDGVGDSCVALVSAGTCDLTPTSAGSPLTLTATYAGDTNFNGSVSAGVSQTVNRPNTTVTSINRYTPAGATTNATSVVWRVTFANPVDSLVASNFALANTGLTAPSITTVSAVTASPDTQWDVTVNTSTGDGTLGLNLANDTGLSHNVTNAPFTGEVYTIDKTAPTVSSIQRQSPSGNPTNADVLVFRVTFSESVTSVNANSFVATGTITPLSTSVTTITPNLVFDFSVDGITDGGNLSSLNGTVGLDIASSPTVKDLAGNTLQGIEPTPSATNDQTYTLDNAAPTVTINQKTAAPAQVDPTNAGPINFTVVFSEPVTGFVTGDINLSAKTTPGTLVGAVIEISPNDGTTYNVAVSGMTGDGDVIATIDASKAQDAAGNNNAASTSTDKTVTYDTIAPTVTDVTSTAANGVYTTGAVIPVTVTFSEPVTVTGTPQLTLETGASDAVVNYTSGSGTATLTFNYTVAAGHTSTDLDYVATTSLALNGGTIKDAATNDATLTLAAPGASGSLGFNKALVIDTTASTVTDVTSTAANATYGTGAVIPVTVTFSEAVNVTGTPKLTLETGATDEAVSYSSGSGTTTLTFNYTTLFGDVTPDLDYVATTSLALNGGTIKDLAGNSASLTLAAPGAAGSLGFNKNIVISATNPAVTNVTSTTANGAYKAGVIIPVTVTFSNAVTVAGGTPQLTLETGATDRVVNYSSGSTTATLTFNYTVQPGDTSADLDYLSTAALVLNGSTIRDASSNNAILTLPAPGAPGSLGANRAIVIDTTAPAAPVVTTPANGSSTNDSTPTISGTAEANSTVNLSIDGTLVGTPPTANGAGNWSYTPGAALSEASHTVNATATDAAGNTGPASGTNTFTIDLTAPTVTINQKTVAPAQADPTKTGPINFTVVFSEPVTGFATGDVTLTGTAPGVLTGTVTGGPTTYDVAVSGMTGSGTVIASILANKAQDLVGNNNTASTSSDQTVTYDVTAPTVTLEQAGGQADPTKTSPINFTATFSKPVTGFATGDVTLSASTTPGTLVGTVTEITPNDGTTYKVAVSGMTGDGTVTATIVAGKAQDAAGNDNVASTSADNSVLYDITAPTTSLTGNPTNPTNSTSASFTFSGADTGGSGVASFECDLDGGGFSACTSAKSYTGLADGSHTFQVRALDNVGLTDASPASYTWVVDTTEPTTSLSGTPANPVASASASFTFSGADTGGSGVASFECDLDGGGFSACASVKPYSGLADGSHTFQVRAIDNAGNTDSSPASYTWVIDATAPTTSLTGNPTDPTSSTSAVFTFTGNDGIGVGGLTFECKLDSGAFAACVSGVSYSSLADGSHTFQVQAKDSLGNTDATPAGYTWTVDTTAPTTSLTGNPTDPANSASASFIFSGADTGGSGVASFECDLDGGGFSACTSAKSYTGLADGSHTFQVRAIDNVGLTDASPASYTWVVDTIAPTTSLSGTPVNPTNSASANFTFSGADTGGSGVANFECDLDGGGFSACTSAKSYSSLADGSHTFQVRAIDHAGNVDATPASFTWVVDATGPGTTLTGNPTNPTNTASATFNFTGNDGTGVGGLTFECKLDTGAYAVCTSGINYPGLVDGSHTFLVRAIDSLGNTDATPASYTWTVDTTGPSVLSITTTVSNPTNVSPIPVTVTFSEPVCGFHPLAGDLQLVNATTSDLTSGSDGSTVYTFDLTPSGQGLVSVLVLSGSVYDGDCVTPLNSNSANSSTLSRTYDTVKPTVTIDQAGTQADPTSVSPVNFTAVFSEPVTGFTGSDVSLSGTAGATTAVVTEIAPLDGTKYNVAVSGMTANGTVIADIPAGGAKDAAQNTNVAATFTDHTVTASPPLITSADHVTFVVGTSGTFTVTTSGSPISALSKTGTLPGGVTFVDNGDGTATLSGTPGVGMIGAYPLTVTASNGGLATQAFTLTVEGPAGVVKINSFADTGDAQVDENEHTKVDVTQLLVVFNKDMNAGEANTLANYTLVKDPATPVNVDTAAYGVPSKTTTLGINGGVALSEGKYTLTVKNTLHDSLGYALSADFVRVFWIDKTGIQVLTNGVALPDHTLVFDGATLNTSVTEIWVQFNEDAANPAGDADPEDVTNPANYLLVRPGPNGIVDTLTCLAGLQGDDLAVPTGPVTYDNGGGVGPDLAKVRINNGTPLENGIYKLLICGTTSVTDLAGNHLNNGADQALNFTVLVLPSSSSSKASGTSRGKALTNPNTGFEPGVFTVLPAQPTEKAYADLGSLQIEIPALNLKTSIAGVPLSSQGWDLTWLAKQVGWLQGTAFPTWEGNSVLTAHSYTSDGLPGPFARLKDLHYDDLIIIRFGGLKYTYAVRNMYLVTSADTQWVTRSEKRAWLTLITCQQFDDRTKSYLYRDIARAVLLKVETER